MAEGEEGSGGSVGPLGTEARRAEGASGPTDPRDGRGSVLRCRNRVKRRSRADLMRCPFRLTPAPPPFADGTP